MTFYTKKEENMDQTLLLYDKLGFMINLKISKTIPNQKRKIFSVSNWPNENDCYFNRW